MDCPSCGHKTADAGRYCSHCAAPMPAAEGTDASLLETAAAPVVAPAKVSAPPQARFVPGTMLAERYRVVAQIGRGGMGEVYRAEDVRLGQTVALKFLPVLHGRDPEHLAQLHREVRIARQISHPNVCRVFDIGDADGAPFLTMEFVDGEDLGSLMKRIGRLQPEKATQLGQQLCAGLAEAHDYGMLHRDLKPANIMLDGRGNVRITDFGLAIDGTGGEQRRCRVGTPAYMAPEQLAGDKPTVQSDIYALGLVLYELFTGKEAFPGATVREILEQRSKGAPAKISRHDQRARSEHREDYSAVPGKGPALAPAHGAAGRSCASGRRPARGHGCRRRDAIARNGCGSCRSAASFCRPLMADNCRSDRRSIDFWISV